MWLRPLPFDLAGAARSYLSSVTYVYSSICSCSMCRGSKHDPRHSCSAMSLWKKVIHNFLQFLSHPPYMICHERPRGVCPIYVVSSSRCFMSGSVRCSVVVRDSVLNFKSTTPLFHVIKRFDFLFLKMNFLYLTRYIAKYSNIFDTKHPQYQNIFNVNAMELIWCSWSYCIFIYINLIKLIVVWFRKKILNRLRT